MAMEGAMIKLRCANTNLCPTYIIGPNVGVENITADKEDETDQGEDCFCYACIRSILLIRCYIGRRGYNSGSGG